MSLVRTLAPGDSCEYAGLHLVSWPRQAGRVSGEDVLTQLRTVSKRTIQIKLLD